MILNSQLWSVGVQCICPVFEKPCHHKTFYNFLPTKQQHCLQLSCFPTLALFFPTPCHKKKVYKSLSQKPASLRLCEVLSMHTCQHTLP